MLVFVYGTLKEGHGNNYLLSSSEFKGEATIRGHTLVLMQSFPYMIESDENKVVRGEVYEVKSPEIERRLDALEGYPSHYQKKTVKTMEGDEVQVYYIDKEEPHYHRIVDMGQRLGTGPVWGGKRLEDNI